ncbi:acyltransferase [Vibrio sp. 99-70-13A1]|uniref:acyltransferase n=1 Tax=Vibrio TaxID=662 RepID=UPI0014939341|nr:acyltransferase [Vibrio sp. 99-70-13A1]NOH99436.1 acyltransferase [Vibrio sp. 99-70-13A1]
MWNIIEILIKIYATLCDILPQTPRCHRIRGWIYRPFCKKIGKNFQVDRNVQLQGLRNIEIGDDVYIGYGSWIHGLREGVEFSDQVMLGPYVTIVAGNHGKERGSFRFAQGEQGKVRVGYGVWLAAKVTVVAGVTIGDGSLIGANSVVTHDIPVNVLAAGIPCTVKKDV